MAFRLLKLWVVIRLFSSAKTLLSARRETHAQGNPYGDQQQNYLHNPIEVEGNYTPSLKSNPILKMFHNAYEVDVANHQGTVINATEGGAKIAGTVVSTLQEALDQHLDGPIEVDGKSITDLIRSKLRFPSDAEQSSKVVEQTDAIAAAINYLESVDEKVAATKAAAETFSKLIENHEDISPKKLKRKREKVIHSMNQISVLSTEPEFRRIAMDMVSAVFFHTMADYIQALANAEDENTQDKELARNAENLANNFEVLLRYVKALYEGHLNLLKEQSANQLADPKTVFERQPHLDDYALTNDRAKEA